MKHLRNISKRVWIIAMLTITGLAVQAQNRSYIRDQIKEWGECRNVALTKSNGNIALYGQNGYAASNIPTQLSDAIKELHAQNEYIDDIELTENGSWVLLYGDNGLRWSNIPSRLEKVLREYNEDQEVITTVTFNDAGEWIVVSTDHFTTSDSEFTDWLKDGMERYGKIWTACMTNDGLVAVFEDGYKFYGNVPSDLKAALKSTDLNVYRLKISGTAWFFADKYGSYQYNM